MLSYKLQLQREYDSSDLALSHQEQFEQFRQFFTLFMGILGPKPKLFSPIRMPPNKLCPPLQWNLAFYQTNKLLEIRAVKPKLLEIPATCGISYSLEASWAYADDFRGDDGRWKKNVSKSLVLFSVCRRGKIHKSRWILEEFSWHRTLFAFILMQRFLFLFLLHLMSLKHYIHFRTRFFIWAKIPSVIASLSSFDRELLPNATIFILSVPERKKSRLLFETLKKVWTRIFCF